MKSEIRDHKGFTLVEMIIAVAMISIFFTVVVAVMSRTLNTYVTMKETTDAIKIADVVGNGTVKELEFAQKIEFGADGMEYSVNKGKTMLPLNNTAPVTGYTDSSIIIEGKPEIFGTVFDPEVYDNNSVKLQITRMNTRVLAVDIEVFSDNSGELLYKTRRTVYLYNVG